MCFTFICLSDLLLLSANPNLQTTQPLLAIIAKCVLAISEISEWALLSDILLWFCD